jgi:fructuronate reductase
MPVVVNPIIIKPEQFLQDVLTKRLPNPFMPDTPQRIATDTSQKLPIRFGQTLRAYTENTEFNISSLTMIPLVIAGWLRYLLGVNDEGKAFTRSSDPRLDELTELVNGIELGKESVDENGIDIILQDQRIFCIDLKKNGLDDKIKGMFKEMTVGAGAVRKTLIKYCK